MATTKKRLAKKKKAPNSPVCKDCIIKRKGREERYDERKVYASCYAASLSAHVHKTDAEQICAKVCKEINSWLKGKPSVTSNQLFEQIAKTINQYHRDSAFMYRTHRDIN
jgi:transcriptional regulator NrdR family protein